MEYKKNSQLEVTITDMGMQGEGIGKVEGYTLFVKDAIVGDTVQARITKPKKNYAYARCEKVLVPSPFRVLPACAQSRRCGGCQLMAMSYEKQLALKQEKVKNNLMRLGGFAPEFLDCIMEPIAGMEVPYRYRNKAQYPVGRDKDGKCIAGFYAGRTHTIIPSTDCLLGAQTNEIILQTILSFMDERHIAPYDEKTGDGLVRHILIRTGFATGQIMVCIVINGDKLPASNLLAERLMGLNEGGLLKMEITQNCVKIQEEITAGQSAEKSVPESEIPSEGKDIHMTECKTGDESCTVIPMITSISLNINKENTNVILGDQIRLLYGEPYITDYIGEVAFRISPLSFYQVNPLQTKVLYDTALEYADLTGKETVWDLYCGIGTISLFLAQRAKQVYGVEVVPQAIEDARKNTALNDMHNVKFFVGKAEEVLPDYYAQHQGSEMTRPDVIVVDPPRKGCDEACLTTMLAMQPQRIVYVSCDSATLARDLKILCEGGYEVKRVRPVDMFGHTVHVETVALLVKER